MTNVHIDTSHPYDVLIGPGLLDEAGALMKQAVGLCTAAIVTDSTVDRLYGDRLESSLRAAGYETVRTYFPAGEQHKRLGTLEAILEFLAERHLTRTDVIVALGGGVPGDVAGFAAAVYARGIRFVQVPTTLLAAVDSSVGGKTAVDLAAGKNLAGAFHQPSLVITDTDIMRDLPEALLADGAAEIIKYGVLSDPEMFEWMRNEGWKTKLDEIISRSVQIKRDFVNRDEFDTGLRQQLNLGHTFGHAIEKCSGFRLSHGQSVAIGTAIAAGAAGLEEMVGAILDANRACGLPVDVPYDATTLAASAMNDKKRKGASITLVLPERIGLCRLETIDISLLEDAFTRGIAMVEAAR
ncbi:MAG: 3-dehydroquinate synthase [Clostridiales bacterium]|nr:3-dehydroquinate synthase [Clostridiales bacterium]